MPAAIIMTSLSTHILDLGTGQPAANVGVVLDAMENDDWIQIASARTDESGRIARFDVEVGSGMHRLRFATGEYGNTFLPEVHLVVEVSGEQDHYHLPLLLSPFGYSTYRGT